jgi:hypothetical protein
MSAFIRKLVDRFAKTNAAKTRQRSRPKFTPGIESLESRLNPGSANPTNVTAIYDAAAHSLSVSFQEAVGSHDTPVYAAAFLDPANPSTGGGLTLNAVTTSGSNVLTFPADTTLGLLPGQTVTGSGIPAGTTIVSVDSSSQVTLSNPATATSLTTAGTSLTFTLVLNGTLTSGSNTVTGLSSTAGLWIGESVLGTGVPIPKLPTNPTAGTPETITTITSIGADGHSITLSGNATVSGTESLTFVTGLALDGSGMEFLGNTIDTTTVFTQTYTYSSTYQNPFLLTTPPDVCMTMYHNTGVASGFHSVVGDGPGLNTDNSLTNDHNTGDFWVYNGLIDYNLSGKIDGGDSTPTSVVNGTLTTGSTTVTGLLTVVSGKTTSGSATVTLGGPGTTALFVGESVTGAGIPDGTTIAAINSNNSITLSQNATATSGGTNLTFNLAGGLYVGEYVTGSGLPAGDQVAAIGPAAGTITLTTAATATGGKALTFDTATVAGYRIINGAVDLNHDGTISNADTTSTLAGHPQFASFNVIGGKVDFNGDGKIDPQDTGDTGIEAICATPTVINNNTNQASVSGFVFLDNSGFVGPLGGVTLTLTSTTNPQVNFTTTTNLTDGSYSFGSLPAGTYTITETVPTGDAPESASAGTVNGATDGTVDSTYTQILNILLGPTDTGTNYDFTNTVPPQT